MNKILTLILTSNFASFTAAESLNDRRKPELITNSAPSVIIIGAGMSGASAANALVAKGYNVTIVEARDRIGGRTYTDRTSLSHPVDLGAGWIHEAVGNPLTNLCASYKISTAPTNYDNN